MGAGSAHVQQPPCAAMKQVIGQRTLALQASACLRLAFFCCRCTRVCNIGAWVFAFVLKCSLRAQHVDVRPNAVMRTSCPLAFDPRVSAHMCVCVCVCVTEKERLWWDCAI